MKSLENLPLNSKIATGSPRRIDQLKILRPDITAMPIRGNVDTRIRKSKENGYQGIILAAAGLNRLNMEYTGFPLEIDTFIPAPAQGILGLENRVDDEETLAYLRPLHDEDSHRQALAERAFLRYVDGGCHAPMGGALRYRRRKFHNHRLLSGRRSLSKRKSPRRSRRRKRKRQSPGFVVKGESQK